ncbi:MAG: hypothetical protein Fur002_23050 [Anaerolineales bacterium]
MKKALLLSALAFYLILIFAASFMIRGERYFTLVDDAMISMRYARNLAQGQGLVWNVGDAPVQGFTNLGWTLFMALIHLLPLPASKISLAVALTSALILLGNIVLVQRIASALAPQSKYAPLMAAILVAFYFPLVFWSLRGMEVGALTALVSLALFLALTDSKPAWVGAALALAVFIRVDAALAAGVILLYLFLKKKRGFLPALMVALTLAGIFYFQKIYFGDFLPATYYQKVYGYSMLERAKRGALVFIQYASRDTLLPLLFSLAAMTFYKNFSRENFLLLGIFGAQVAYSIYAGGDYAEPETNAANRFITQGMPAMLILFALMASRVLSDLEELRARRAESAPRVNPAIAWALMILVLLSGEPWAMYAVENAPLWKADARRVRLALHIAANTDESAVIAVHAAGQIPYYSERRTIDLLGLNDLNVAKGNARGAFYPGHNKWDYEYSIGELQPDVIADNFEPLGDYMKKNAAYQMLESDIYVRKDSALVNVKGLNSKSYR